MKKRTPLYIKVPHIKKLNHFIFYNIKNNPKIKKNRLKLLKYFFNGKIESAIGKNKQITKKIIIRINQNNIFCSLINMKKKKIIYNCSSGMFNLKVSRKQIKYHFKRIIILFLKKIKKQRKNYNNIIFSIISPITLRKKIIHLISNKLKIKKRRKIWLKKKLKQNIIIEIPAKKIFNGCNARKIIKKKRRFNRIFK
jgi:hypothetical protein